MLRKLGLFGVVCGAIILGNQGGVSQTQKKEPDYHKYRLSDLIDTAKEYRVWIEDSNLKECYPVGEIKPCGEWIIFAEKKTKPIKNYTVTPLTEKVLPDGTIEIEVLTPEGVKIQKIPSKK